MARPEEVIEADASLVVQVFGEDVSISTDMGSDDLIELLLEIIDRVEAGAFSDQRIGRVQ